MDDTFKQIYKSLCSCLNATVIIVCIICIFIATIIILGYIFLNDNRCALSMFLMLLVTGIIFILDISKYVKNNIFNTARAFAEEIANNFKITTTLKDSDNPKRIRNRERGKTLNIFTIIYAITSVILFFIIRINHDYNYITNIIIFILTLFLILFINFYVDNEDIGAIVFRVLYYIVLVFISIGCSIKHEDALNIMTNIFYSIIIFAIIVTCITFIILDITEADPRVVNFAWFWAQATGIHLTGSGTIDITNLLKKPISTPSNDNKYTLESSESINSSSKKENKLQLSEQPPEQLRRSMRRRTL